MPLPFRWLTCVALLVMVGCSGSPNASPKVTIQGPANTMPAPGENVSLESLVDLGNILESPANFSYQWMKDGKDLPGAVTYMLTMNPVALSDAGAYQVRVTAGTETLMSPVYSLEPADHGWVVTSDADDGPGSLRQVLTAAAEFPGVNGIRFALPPARVNIITLQSDLPPITSSISILGPSDPPLILDGGGAHRPFFVNGGTLDLDGFTVSGGFAKGGDALGGGGAGAGMGGALLINKGTVTLRNMIFKGNQAQGGTSSPGSDGENGGGAGISIDSPASGGRGANGGVLGGKGGEGFLDGTATSDAGGGPALDGDGAGGGAARGGLLTDPVRGWADNLPGGDATFGGGGGFSVGPLGGGGNGSSFGGGGGSSGGTAQGIFLPGAAGGTGGIFGGDGVPGDGVTGGTGGGGGGMGGAIFLRDGTLSLSQCSFIGNSALRGNGGEPGLGKGGAIFIYKFDESAPFSLALLKAQTYVENVASDLAEDGSFDNNDYYVAQTLLALKLGSPLDMVYRRYKLDRKMGIPARR